MSEQRESTSTRAATRNRGDGRIFERKGSSFLWIAYYHHGKQIRESSETTDREKARKFLKRRLEIVGAEKQGKADFIGPKQERLKVGKLLDALESDFRNREKDSPQFQSHMKRVRSYFGTWKALDVIPSEIEKYIQCRRVEGAKAATINRETQLLGQAFRKAVADNQLSDAPKIQHLTEKNVRKGFFETADLDVLLENLPAYLRDFVHFGFLTGWRKGEIASLRWEDVEGDVIRLRAENSKNREPRSLPLVGDLAELIERRKAARQVKTENGGVMLAARVFHLEGIPVGDFRKAWATACVQSGLGKFKCEPCKLETAERKCPTCHRETTYCGRIFHDFRRSAARNMRKAGVPETVAMSVTGHKTRSMFDRYDIKDEADQRDALNRTQDYLKRGTQESKTPVVMRRAGAEN